MCFFTDINPRDMFGFANGTDTEYYQLCDPSCRRHMWSKRRSCAMLVRDDGTFLVSGSDGTRVKVGVREGEGVRGVRVWLSVALVASLLHNLFILFLFSFFLAIIIKK